jgi:hypothetical protein
MRWAVERTGEMTNANNILVVKYQRKGQLGKPRCRWKVDIKIELTNICCEELDWIQLPQ